VAVGCRVAVVRISGVLVGPGVSDGRLVAVVSTGGVKLGLIVEVGRDMAVDTISAGSLTDSSGEADVQLLENVRINANERLSQILIFIFTRSRTEL